MTPKLDPVEALFRRRQRNRARYAKQRLERRTTAEIVAENRRLLQEKELLDGQLRQQEEQLSTAAATIEAKTATCKQLYALLDKHLTSTAAMRADASRRKLEAAKLADEQAAELEALRKRLAAEQRRTAMLTKDNARLQTALDVERAAKCEVQAKLTAIERKLNRRRQATIGERQEFLSRFDDMRSTMRSLDASTSDSAIIRAVDSTLPVNTGFMWLRNRAAIEGHRHSKQMRSTIKRKRLAVDAFVES